MPARASTRGPTIARRAGSNVSADEAAATVEPVVSFDYHGVTVCKTGPWGAGPVALQQLALLAGFDLGSLSEEGLNALPTQWSFAETAAAKHGLEGLSKVIALEAAGKGVTSNTVCPGYVRTPLVEGQIAAQAETHGIPESDVLDEVLLARTPVKRLVEPEEVAEMVGYLCGAGAASITGSSFLLDGGWTAA